MLREEILKETTGSIMDVFEELLDKHNIDIPNDEKSGVEGEAILYGSEYYETEDEIMDLVSKALNNFAGPFEEEYDYEKEIYFENPDKSGISIHCYISTDDYESNKEAIDMITSVIETVTSTDLKISTF